VTTRPFAASAAFPSLVRYRARVLEATGAAEIARELERTETAPETLESLSQRGRIFSVRLDDVPDSAAAVLGRELGAVGGEFAGPAPSTEPHPRVHVLLATRAQYRRLLPRLRRQPLRVREIADAVEAALAHFTAHRPRQLRGLHRSVPLGDRTRVMGIVNVTPDSFFDGGKYLDPERAVHRAVHLIEEGADLLDLGAESTRPGSSPVSADAELARLLPVLSKLHAESDVPISVDTRKAEVARVALDAGADLVNDVSGLRHAEMRRLLARTGAPAIAMHMRGTPATMQADLD
jgi:dihydropteroate synthase